MQRKAVRKSTIAFIDKEPIHHGEKNELKQITTPKNEWKFAALPTTTYLSSAHFSNHKYLMLLCLSLLLLLVIAYGNVMNGSLHIIKPIKS